jgi:hypothetical protein
MEMTSRNLPGVTEKDHQNIPAKINGVPVEIRTKNLQINV